MITFHSKRNTVFAEQGIVHKKLTTPELAQAEAGRLRLLGSKTVCVPKVLEVKDCNLQLSYVEGETLTDFIDLMEEADRLDTEKIDAVAKALSKWLGSYYHAMHWEKTNMILDDVNCRNFIVTPTGDICGVDFEADAFGAREKNIGGLLAFVMTYYPEGTPVKLRFFDTFKTACIEELHVSGSIIDTYYSKELSAIAQRRTGKNIELRGECHA